MDVTSTPVSSKRSRAKSTAKDPSATPARKTLTARKKPSPPATVIATTPDTAAGTPHDLTEMIATAAFYLAAERGFAPGHELDDWLEAERRIRASHPA